MNKILPEKYWVVSNGEDPLQIYFTAAQAILSNEPYIDSFDEYGHKVRAMKRVGDCNYTTDF